MSDRLGHTRRLQDALWTLVGRRRRCCTLAKIPPPAMVADSLGEKMQHACLNALAVVDPDPTDAPHGEKME